MVNFFQSSLRPTLRIVCAATALGLSACEDNQAHTAANGTAYHHNHIDPKEIPPHYGMNRDEVFRLYGEPNRKYFDDLGETWVYYLNAGEIVGKSFIPFYVPPRLRTGVLTFGPDGRVAHFRWQPDAHQAQPQDS